jgi:hypothetical protein
MQIHSGFNENAQHFFDSLDADFVPQKPVAIPATASVRASEEAWGSSGGLPQETPPQPPVQTNTVAQLPDPKTVEPIDRNSYDFLDRSYRDNITTIEQAILQIEGEIMPGAHPKLLESYAQLLERRTSAINSYTEFLKLRRKSEIEERKIRIAEKKAGMGVKTGDAPSNGLTMSPRQLAEFMRELDASRMSEIPEAEEVPSDGKPDRSFE